MLASEWMVPGHKIRIKLVDGEGIRTHIVEITSYGVQIDHDWDCFYPWGSILKAWPDW